MKQGNAVWPVVWAIGVLVAGQAAASSKSAGLRGNPGMFFGPGSYPAEAIRLQQQGRVVTRLAIDSSGKVMACTVQESSGAPSLDQRTCEIALEKVVFDPARDDKGNPISSTYILPVRWILPSGPRDVGKAPPPNLTMDITLSVSEGGVVMACNGTLTPKPEGDIGPCDQFPVGSQTEFNWVRDGKPVGGVIKRHFTQEITVNP
ncbi:MAG: energy transducer TonB [Pseudomonadota bacterium]|nr:energy transducer TonB [Pseudomonadota bacterium]